MPQLNKYQMRPAYGWGPGVTQRKHVAEIFAKQPIMLNDVVTRAFTANNGYLFSTFLKEHTQVREFDADEEYTWKLVGSTYKNIPLIEARKDDGSVVAASDTNVGRGGTLLQLVFPEAYFADGEVIVGELNEYYQFRIIEEPVMEGSNAVYTVELMAGADEGCPGERLLTGERFSWEFAPVESELSRRVGGIRNIDEQIAFRYAMTHKPDLVINVIDATALERSLLLTLQLRELGLPVLVVLNKYDVVRKRRQSIEIEALSQVLGCPVVALSAYNRKEILLLKQQLPQLIAQSSGAPLALDYGATIEAAVAELAPQVLHPHLAPRGCALRLLEGAPLLDESLQLTHQLAVAALIQRTQSQFDLDLSLADVRYGFIHEQARPCVVQHGKLGVKGS